ncbi:uncharacterized protein LOC124938201 [Impatiens glandulifera]|uniref:uncharacterized protein LOC124938201 n=1 Tax=Impatiens glandulifera TaxID=253017 RepID=UPI001FB0B737|nr:uncharacterized protein LOC124938201 [Impatiens glandulifera]
MDLPDTDEVKPEKLEEVKEVVLLFNCDLYDSEIIHKIALSLLPGLGAACIDNTTGGLFRSPASVALEMRRAMVEYLTNRSETFVAESIILEDSPEASDHPYDIIADFIEDFATSKRNIFSRVSGWILSERREDKIDDFVQDMEMDGFWILERKESIAKTLLKNVDTKNLFHCSMKFNSEEELAEHSLTCSFRTMDCMHEGCDARFSAAHLENHESICPFKIISCEQKCPANIMRRQMDRHCITVCPMKIINCTFYSAGCQSTFPQSEIEHHRVQSLLYHIVLVLRVIHKDAADEDLDERSKKVEELASPGRLASARDVRSLTMAVKDIESKLGPLQVRPKDTQQEPPRKDEGTESTKETDLPIIEKESSKEPSGSPSIKGILKTTDNTTKVEVAESTKESNSPTISKDSSENQEPSGSSRILQVTDDTTKVEVPKSTKESNSPTIKKESGENQEPRILQLTDDTIKVEVPESTKKSNSPTITKEYSENQEPRILQVTDDTTKVEVPESIKESNSPTIKKEYSENQEPRILQVTDDTTKVEVPKSTKESNSPTMKKEYSENQEPSGSPSVKGILQVTDNTTGVEVAESIKESNSYMHN